MIGASRKRLSRGVNVVEPNCTTRNSNEYTTAMRVIVPAPIATSNSAARELGTVKPMGMLGTTNASTTADMT